MTDAPKKYTQTVNVTGVDAYSPYEIAKKVETAGVVKAGLPIQKLLLLGFLAGVFIGFGGALYTLAITGSPAGFGLTKILGGMAFSLGLVLVIIGGAELFTGSNLIVMAWADGKVTTSSMLRNWGFTFLSNAIGALAIAVLIYMSGVLDGGGMDKSAIKIAEAKLGHTPLEAFIRGILCNALVCLAVWLSFAAQNVSGKVLAIMFPVTAFVALGFEHCIANFYLIPIGLMAGADGGLTDFVANLIPVTLGNIVGGAGGVAGFYWLIYGR